MSTPPCPPTPLAVCLPADKLRLLVELVRSMKEKAEQAVVEIRDESGEVLGCFVPAEAGAATKSGESPAFYAELRRRYESSEPALPVEEVSSFLDREGEALQAVLKPRTST